MYNSLESELSCFLLKHTGKYSMNMSGQSLVYSSNYLESVFLSVMSK